jgi:hypothetical protein
MVDNRFRGHINTSKHFEELEAYGILPGVLAELDIVADLSEAGLGSDTGFNEDYSSTATFASYKATADCVIHRMILSLDLSTYTGSAVNEFILVQLHQPLFLVVLLRQSDNLSQFGELLFNVIVTQ